MNISLIAGIAEKLREWLTGWFGAIMSIIPKSIYALCTFIFYILDILQMLVRKLAGLDQVYYTSTDWGTTVEGQSGDIVYNLIQNIFLGQTPILTNVFWSMIILGVIMLFLTTLVAVLRSEYSATDEKVQSKGKIIGQAFKAIASFAVVPIVAFFGIFLANVILQALDTITSGSVTVEIPQSGQSLLESQPAPNGSNTFISYNLYGHRTPTTSTPISGQIFRAAAYKSNRIRYYTLFQQNYTNEDVGAGLFNLITNQEHAAALLDDAFANCYSLKNSKTLTVDPFTGDFLFQLGGGDSFFSNKAVTVKSFDKTNVALVWYYYDLWAFDFIICIGALVVAGKLLFDLVFGLMKRIFEVVILFLIAAPISSLMPLDNGAALGKWRQKFISKVIGAYAPIVGLNLLFIILPWLSTIRFFNIEIVDKIVNILFMLVGLLMVKDLVATIAELIGGDDTAASGEKMAGAVGGTLASVGKVATTPARFAVGAAKVAGKTVGYAAGKIKKHRDHMAEKGAIIGGLGTDADPNLGGQSERDYFNSLSGHKQRKFLKQARLKMSESDRELAHYDNRKENIRSYKTWGNIWGGTGVGYKSPDALRTEKEEKAVERNKKLEDKKKELLSKNLDKQESEFISKLKPKTYEERIAARLFMRGLNGSDEAKANWDKGSLKEKREMMRIRGENLTSQDRANVANYYNARMNDPNYVDPLFKPTIKEPSSLRTNIERYKNFNAKHFGAKGTLEREQTEDKIAARKQQEKAIYGAGLAKEAQEFARGFGDALTTIFKTLGGEFAKGFKDAGGLGAIWANLQGLSEKKQAVQAEVKNQKKILYAQREADKLLGGGKGKSTIDLSDDSAKKIADAIASRLKPNS